MIRITKDEIMHPTLLVAAKCFHQRRGDSRIHVPQMIAVSHRQDGCGSDIYMLTRYVDGNGKAMSSIVAWDNETETVNMEVACALRKMEPMMIAMWERRMKGGEECDT